MTEGIAIITSGGDAAGMNPAIKCAADYASRKGLKPWLVYGGLNGLIKGDIVEAERSLISGILHRGGTSIRSSRSKEFFELSYREKAYRNLKERGINKLLVIGGDGSFRALNQFYTDFGMPFAGIPATIDNDIAGTDYCLGVDTALNMIRQSIDSIRDTATSFSRAFVIEVMGRHCGYLAMVSALASGAEICLTPEIPYNLDSIGARLKHQIENEGRDTILAIVAEGTKMGDYVTRWINDSIGMEARLTVLGHVQRGGSPTVYDRIMAYKFSVAAIDSLTSGQENAIMVHSKGTFGSLPISEVCDAKSEMDPWILNLCKPLSE